MEESGAGQEKVLIPEWVLGELKKKKKRESKTKKKKNLTKLPVTSPFQKTNLFTLQFIFQFL